MNKKLVVANAMKYYVVGVLNTEIRLLEINHTVTPPQMYGG
jgi:hypothetical protein